MDLVECRHCGHDQSEHAELSCSGEDIDLDALTLRPCTCRGFSAVETDA